jgi:hypothetical protein
MQRLRMYVDNMPIEDIPKFNEDQIKHIKQHVYNTADMRERNEDVSKLLDEAYFEYCRVMNSIVFIESLKRQESPTQEFTIEIVEPLPIDTSKPHVPRYEFFVLKILIHSYFK